MPVNRQRPYSDDELVVAYAWWERNRQKTANYYAGEFEIMAARLFAIVLSEKPDLRARCEQANTLPLKPGGEE